MKDSEFHVDCAQVLKLADQTGCTTYDCEFVSVAQALGVKLITADKQLLKAFPRIAMSLI